MRIAILSCFYPYRGGISQFNAEMYSGLGKIAHVKAFNFKRQYPSFLFPGKTQFVTPEDEAKPVESTAILDSVNPISWVRTARAIRRWKPDVLVMSWWMSWFGPSLGYVARHAGCRSIAVLHNAIPHEPRFFDRPLTKYFLKGCDGAVTLSSSVEKDLERLLPGIPHILHPHPVYSHFGESIPREKAVKALGLDPAGKVLLFFGLIREYKGLDILLEAFRGLPPEYQLVIAGEPYGSFDRYASIIAGIPDSQKRIKVFPEYVRDSRVKDFFCAADLAVLPYRSATQSGISAICIHFSLPLLVTDVGGLRESVGDTGIGVVVDKADANAVREGILGFFASPEAAEKCRKAAENERERLSWDGFCSELSDFASSISK